MKQGKGGSNDFIGHKDQLSIERGADGKITKIEADDNDVDLVKSIGKIIVDIIKAVISNNNTKDN